MKPRLFRVARVLRMPRGGSRPRRLGGLSLEGVPLSPRDRDLLYFESRWNGHSAAKEEAIARDLAMTPARYYQLLERVIDVPDAAEHDAMLVHRLRRLRERRTTVAVDGSSAMRTGTAR